MGQWFGRFQWIVVEGFREDLGTTQPVYFPALTYDSSTMLVESLILELQCLHLQKEDDDITYLTMQNEVSRELEHSAGSYYAKYSTQSSHCYPFIY